jgi:hypothetical protein
MRCWHGVGAAHSHDNQNQTMMYLREACHWKWSKYHLMVLNGFFFLAFWRLRSDLSTEPSVGLGFLRARLEPSQGNATLQCDETV